MAVWTPWEPNKDQNWISYKEKHCFPLLVSTESIQKPEIIWVYVGGKSDRKDVTPNTGR